MVVVVVGVGYGVDCRCKQDGVVVVVVVVCVGQKLGLGGRGSWWNLATGASAGTGPSGVVKWALVGWSECWCWYSLLLQHHVIRNVARQSFCDFGARIVQRLAYELPKLETRVRTPVRADIIIFLDSHMPRALCNLHLCDLSVERWL